MMSLFVVRLCGCLLFVVGAVAVAPVCMDDVKITINR